MAWRTGVISSQRTAPLWCDIFPWYVPLFVALLPSFRSVGPVPAIVPLVRGLPPCLPSLVPVLGLVLPIPML